ncbi:flavin reductase family protein [Actinomadura sp. LOL_016]|uniref:flavin reductase family protein n=1 Tax=unclassified Actinomadura TaxID=2626254 RepID=UPI003A811041
MTGTAAPIDPRAFRETLGHYPTGVAVVTGIGRDGEPVGMVVGSFTSISLDPPLVAFSPRKGSKTFAALRNSPTFCVNVLAADQEAICRRFASSDPRKYDGVGWSPAPGGAPILADVVSWIECSWESTLEGGDHDIVLGRVLDLAVSRPSLPLLFFQGGYGRFSLPSLTASDPDLIEAVGLAERIRAEVEGCRAELGVDCVVTAKVAGEVVTVLSAQGTETTGRSLLGQRVPHLAPLGSVFLRDGGAEEEEQWTRHLAGAETGTLDRIRRNLAVVRERGYSIALTSEMTEERRALMAAYSSPNGMPAHARRIRELIAASVDIYEPDIEEGRTYDLYSVSCLVDGPDGCPPIAIRLLGLPPDASADMVRHWVDTLRMAAAKATAILA